MSEGLVVGAAFAVTYGLILGYAVYLHFRRRKSGS